METRRTLRIESDPTVISYTFDAMMAITDVREGRKPLAIISAGKSITAYEIAADIVIEDNDLDDKMAMFVCEDGELHEHIFICRQGAPYAREAVEMIFDTVQEFPTVTRKQLQARLGGLLGYGAKEILDFTRSELGKTCPCDCCGGSETVDRHAKDAQVRRTMYHA